MEPDLGLLIRLKARALVVAHFDRINAGDLEGARAQLYIPAEAQGRPTEVYLAAMRRIAPLRLLESSVRMFTPVRARRAGSFASVWLRLEVESAAGPRAGTQIVWWFPEGDRALFGSRLTQWGVEKGAGGPPG